MALPGFGRPPIYYFIWILPRNSFSRLCGLVADARLPSFLLKLLIRLFSWKYGVNLKEASKKVSEYRNFNDFFTRSLRPGSRLIANSDIVSPADGVVSQFGFIDIILLGKRLFESIIMPVFKIFRFLSFSLTILSISLFNITLPIVSDTLSNIKGELLI